MPTATAVERGFATDPVEEPAEGLPEVMPTVTAVERGFAADPVEEPAEGPTEPPPTTEEQLVGWGMTPEDASVAVQIAPCPDETRGGDMLAYPSYMDWIDAWTTIDGADLLALPRRPMPDDGYGGMAVDLGDPVGEVRMGPEQVDGLELLVDRGPVTIRLGYADREDVSATTVVAEYGQQAVAAVGLCDLWTTTGTYEYADLAGIDVHVAWERLRAAIVDDPAFLTEVYETLSPLPPAWEDIDPEVRLLDDPDTPREVLDALDTATVLVQLPDAGWRDLPVVVCSKMPLGWNTCVPPRLADGEDRMELLVYYDPDDPVQLVILGRDAMITDPGIHLDEIPGDVIAVSEHPLDAQVRILEMMLGSDDLAAVLAGQHTLDDVRGDEPTVVVAGTAELW